MKSFMNKYFNLLPRELQIKILYMSVLPISNYINKHDMKIDNVIFKKEYRCDYYDDYVNVWDQFYVKFGNLPSAVNAEIGDIVILNKPYSYWNKNLKIKRKLLKYRVVGFYYSLYEICNSVIIKKDKLEFKNLHNCRSKLNSLGCPKNPYYKYLALEYFYNNKNVKCRRLIPGTHHYYGNSHSYSLYYSDMYKIISI